MTSKADFTDDQWQLLLDVPPAVGTAVMCAGRSGLGTIKESLAMARSILNARHGHDGVELIESLSDARTKHGEKSTIETLSSPYRGLPDREILADAVEKCREVEALLANKATQAERGAYVGWTIRVAEQVALAAKEGGFLGVGGERVSAEEMKALDAIREALGEI